MQEVMLELNKIHLGDCYELIKQIPDKSVDCVYTDVPYLIVDGGKGLSPLGDRAHKIRYDDLKGITDGFDVEILSQLQRVCRKINIFVWCSKMQIADMVLWGKQNNYNTDLLVWTKTNPTPLTNNVWLPDVEYCFHFREKGVPLNNGYKLKSKWYSGAINKRDKDLYEHPTIKPLALVKRHIEHATQPNDIILDPFMGSGTTAVAAQETGRQFIGFEIEPKWHKIACDRVKGITAAGQYSLFGRQ